MKIGVSTLYFWELPIEYILDIFNDIGIKNIEFFPENPEFWENRFNLEYISNLKSEFKKYSVALHCPHIELNPSSLNPYVKEATIKETLWSIELAKFYKCNLITIHPGKRPTNRPPRKEEYNAFYRYVNKSLKEATEKNVMLCLENLPLKVNNIGQTPEDMKNILEKYNISNNMDNTDNNNSNNNNNNNNNSNNNNNNNKLDNLYMTLDFAHSNEYIKEFLEKTIKYIKHTHISGIINNKDHYPITKSQINFKEHINKLLDYGYKGMFNLEIDDKKLGLKENELTVNNKISAILKEIEYLENI